MIRFAGVKARKDIEYIFLEVVPKANSIIAYADKMKFFPRSKGIL